MTREFRTAEGLGALLGLAAHYRLAGWTIEDAVARAEELIPLRGQVLDVQWNADFWTTFDADMAGVPDE